MMIHVLLVNQGDVRGVHVVVIGNDRGVYRVL